MKKRIVSALLCVTMIASLMVGCGTPAAADTTPAATEEAATEEGETTEETATAGVAVEDLKVAVAQSLKNKLNYVEAGVYKQIKPEHIAIVENVAETQKSYEVYFQLETGAPSEWFANENGKYESVSDANAVLKGVANAKVWTNGMAYYIVNIKHLGSLEKTGEELESVYNSAYYGVVRNHAYEVTFNGVVGLGTPVYSATTEYPEPVTPDFTDSYVAAEINVLAWHLVQQEVTLQ